jgi:two-component system, NarL family, response regulator LiaR
VAEQIRVCIADDHTVVRQGLTAFLSSQPDILVVGEAATGEQLLRIAAREQPHVALVDLLMPGIGGIETTRLLRQARPDTQVVVLTSSTAQAHVIRALRAGALSYVLKDSTAEQIAIAIRLAAQGSHTLAPAIRTSAGRLNEPARARGGGLPSLTDRELQVLRCIAAGHNNAIIAEQLSITEGTVKTHVNSILTKLHVSDRTQAAVLAWREGVIDPDIESRD